MSAQCLKSVLMNCVGDAAESMGALMGKAGLPGYFLTPQLYFTCQNRHPGIYPNPSQNYRFHRLLIFMESQTNVLSDKVIEVHQLGKCFHIYDAPVDRLKQSLWRGRRRFFKEFWALSDVSFSVNKGETLGIIGRNGSGKSTLLQLIVGTLAPTTGRISASGRIAALLELGSGFNPDFSGRENVFLNGAILGLSREEVAAKFDDIARFADIGDFIDQPVKTYSSGMMVRLAFSVAINVQPEILVIDEALAVGDIGFQVKCMERLDQLTRSGITMLFVSHDITAVKAFCTKVIYLDHGRVRAIGPASDMVELYLLDNRNAQRMAMGATAAVRQKQPIGCAGAVAFGTDQGHVTRVCFAENDGPEWICATGDKIVIKVEVEYDQSVKNPAVSIVLHDHRMIDLAGRYCRIKNVDTAGEFVQARIEFWLEAKLNTGVYYFTVRLEDRTTDEIFFPIDKQTGALRLHVSRPASRHFIGLMDLAIHSSQDQLIEP